MSSSGVGGSEPFDSSEFRRVMGMFATGVTVVTTLTQEDRPHGLTANAFMSVSLHPPLVLVSIDKKTETHSYLGIAGCFCVNVLRETHKELSDKFASKSPDKFEGVAYRREATGSPVLEDSLAWIDCEVAQTYEGGDHTLFLGKVVALGRSEGSPLLFFEGKYYRLGESSTL